MSAESTVALTAVRAPDQRIRGLLHRDYLGFTQAASTNERWLATPTPSATVILNVADPFGGLPPGFAAGLTDSYEIIEQDGPIACVDLKLSPLGAYTLLGVPMSELTGRVVDLGDVLGAEGRRIIERLVEAPAWGERFDLLDRFLLALADRGPRPADEVSWAWRRLIATNGTVPIGVLDASTAIDWLKKAFGFEEKSVFRDGSGAVVHAQLGIGGGLVMVSPHREDNWLGGHAPDALASPMSIYVIVDDPDEHCRRAKAEDATIVAEPTDMDYGSREYSARDPEGNLWSFGTYNPNAA